ncbi:tetratricopeptide repeat protein, partial [Actinomadura adrarensis]
MHDRIADRHGTDHAETVAARGDLAVALRDEDRLQEARAEAENALRQAQETAHDSVSVLQANLAAILREQGDPAAAGELLDQAA